LKTRICLFVIIVANAVGNLLLAYGMRRVGSIASYSPLELVGAGLQAMTNGWVLAGVLLLLVFFAAHAIVLSWADLSYVLLVTAIGYVLVAVLSRQFLGETISALRWAGTVVITAGVVLVGSTPISTVETPAAGSKAPAPPS
jgi:drug/metabolite transporter (DMT)-like permease